MNTPHTLLIADDHPLFLMGLRYGLQAEGFSVVAEAHDGAEALRLCRERRPDVALLDVKMPHMTGIEVCAELQKEGSSTAAVLITTFSELAIVQAARAAGARGYLSKETEPKELARELRRILNNPEEIYIPEVELPKFTPREQDVLPLLAEGLSNKAIAQRLDLSPDTVKDHLARIYSKLNVRDRNEAVTQARRMGLLELE